MHLREQQIAHDCEYRVSFCPLPAPTIKEAGAPSYSGIYAAAVSNYPRQDSNLRPAVSGLWRFRASLDYTFTVDFISR